MTVGVESLQRIARFNYFKHSLDLVVVGGQKCIGGVTPRQRVHRKPRM